MKQEGEVTYIANIINLEVVPMLLHGVIDPQLELYLPITDMLLPGFLKRRTRICTPFASKSYWLSNNQ